MFIVSILQSHENIIFLSTTRHLFLKVCLHNFVPLDNMIWKIASFFFALNI